jgi:hypothetical protein
MRGAVERERARAAAADARVRELTTRAEQLTTLEKDIRKSIALMGEASSEVAARKEAARVLKAARAQIADNEAETWRLESEKEHLQRTLGTLAERQARLEQQGELKVRDMLPFWAAAAPVCLWMCPDTQICAFIVCCVCAARGGARGAARGAGGGRRGACARGCHRGPRGCQRRRRTTAGGTHTHLHTHTTHPRTRVSHAPSLSPQAATAELRRTHGRDMAAVGARYGTLRETVDEYHMRIAEVMDAPTDDEGEEGEESGREDEGAEAAASDKENETLSSPVLGQAACAALRAEAHWPGDTPAFAFALR